MICFNFSADGNVTATVGVVLHPEDAVEVQVKAEVEALQEEKALVHLKDHLAYHPALIKYRNLNQQRQL